MSTRGDWKKCARPCSASASGPTPTCASPTSPMSWDGEPYAAVLVDAPCSATGIVRRQPDILMHRRESDLAALVALQATLLDAAWRTLATGGVLLYATCSILKDENEAQVDTFLARTPDAVADPLDARFGHAAGIGRQRFPGQDGMDGFFYARMRKR
jgi:16S rRNA (cytosine967-C5)-methyltransferase